VPNPAAIALAIPTTMIQDECSKYLDICREEGIDVQWVFRWSTPETLHEDCQALAFFASYGTGHSEKAQRAAVREVKLLAKKHDVPCVLCSFDKDRFRSRMVSLYTELTDEQPAPTPDPPPPAPTPEPEPTPAPVEEPVEAYPAIPPFWWTLSMRAQPKSIDEATEVATLIWPWLSSPDLYEKVSTWATAVGGRMCTEAAFSARRTRTWRGVGIYGLPPRHISGKRTLVRQIHLKTYILACERWGLIPREVREWEEVTPIVVSEPPKKKRHKRKEVAPVPPPPVPTPVPTAPEPESTPDVVLRKTAALRTVIDELFRWCGEVGIDLLAVEITDSGKHKYTVVQAKPETRQEAE